MSANNQNGKYTNPNSTVSKEQPNVALAATEVFSEVPVVTETAPVEAVVAAATITPPVVTETVITEVISDFEQHIAQLKKNGTAYEIQVIDAFELYISRLKVTVPADSETGIKFQYALWKTIDAVISGFPVEEFPSLWNLMLRYFNYYSVNVFSRPLVYRFHEMWIWDMDELEAYQSSLNIMLLTADPAERVKGIKRVNLDKALSIGFSETGRQRISVFYNA